MANANRMYQRTEDGRSACENAHSGLPQLYQQLLCLTAYAADFAELRETLHDYSEAQIADALEELENLVFVESVALEWLLELDALVCMEPARS
jgi:hypothetical protein